MLKIVSGQKEKTADIIIDQANLYAGGKVAHRGVIVDGKAGGVLKVAYLGEYDPCTFFGRVISCPGQGKMARVFASTVRTLRARLRVGP